MRKAPGRVRAVPSDSKDRILPAGSEHELWSASAPETIRHKVNELFTSLH